MPVRRRCAAGAMALAVIAAALVRGPANADDRPPAGAPLTEAAIAERLGFIEQRLEASRSHGQVWYWSWMAINGGSAAALGIVAGLSDHEDDQVNNGVQAGVAAIGVADLLLRPLEARFGAAPIARLPNATDDERLSKLRAAEALLRANAERAEERTSWLMHGANVGLNAAAGGVIAGFGRPSDGLIAFATGTAGGVINILSQPWAPATDWQAYKARFGDQAVPAPSWQLGIAPLPQQGARLSVHYRW